MRRWTSRGIRVASSDGVIWPDWRQLKREVYQARVNIMGATEKPPEPITETNADDLLKLIPSP